MISGAKKFILSENIKHVSIPQYESLSVKEIKKFMADNPECYQYLPDEKELDKVPKQWLANVLYKVTDQKFLNWVKQRILFRN